MDEKKLKEILKPKKYNEFEVTEELLHAAKHLGISLTALLERIDPSEHYSNQLSKLNALERQLYKKNIHLRADLSKGQFPTELAAVLDSDDTGLRILFAEYLYTKAKESLLTADRYNLEAILATTRYISGGTAEVVTLDFSEVENSPRFKASPGSELPRVKIAWGTETIRLGKSGVAIEFTYEFVRRARIDMVSKIMERLTLSDRKAQFNYAVKEGLFNGTTVENAKDYDSTLTTGDKLSYTGWLKWLHSFGEYTCDIVLGDIDAIVDLVMMAKPNIAPADVIAALSAAKANNEPYILNAPNLTKAPALMVVDKGVIPADHVVGIDSRFALERLVETGSDISKIIDFATKQTNVLVVSLYDGYSKFMSDAIRALNIVSV